MTKNAKKTEQTSDNDDIEWIVTPGQG